MTFRELVPSTILAAARYTRTRGTLLGLWDRKERRRREATINAMRQQASVPAKNTSVLFFSLRGGWYPHVAWEAVLAHALRIRGISVHTFICGGLMPVCEVNFRHAPSALACGECALYPQTLIRGLGLSYSQLREYVTREEADHIESTVSRLMPSDFETWSFADRPIGALVRDSVLWFLRKSTFDMNSGDARIYRDFLIAGANIAILAPRLLKATNPDVVVEVNGRFFAERILNSFISFPTRVVIYEAGWRTNTLGFDHLSVNGWVDLESAWQAWREQPLSDGQNRELDRWVSSRMGGAMERDFYIRFRKSSNPVAAVGLDPQRLTAVLFTNLVWDTAVLGKNAAFTSIDDWLRKTIQEFCRRPHWQLIVRIHPAEDLRPSQSSREKLSQVARDCSAGASNVRIVDAGEPLSSYALIEHCRAVLVYTTTIGLEAAMYGKPVIVAGKPFYRGRSFTLDVADADEYGAVLERIMDGSGAAADSATLAQRFAYLLLFRYLKRIPVVQQRPGRLPLLDPTAVAMLAREARDSDLNEILNAIVTGAVFVPGTSRHKIAPPLDSTLT